MPIVARYWVLALWLAWALAFLLRRVRATRHRTSKTDPVAILGILLQVAAYPVIFIRFGQRLPAVEPWQFAISAALGVISLFLIWSAIPALGKQWRLQAGVYQDHELIQSGPYRLVRHPIYASMLALLLAAGVLIAPFNRIAVAAALLILGIEVRIHAEERLLTERFGQEYTAYKARVPAYIPFIR